MADRGEQDTTKRRSRPPALITASASPLHEQNEQNISITTSWKSLFRFTTLIHLPILMVSIVVTIVAGVVRVIFALYLGKLFGVLSQFGIGTLTGSQLLDRTRDYTFIILILGGISWVSSSGFYFLWTVFGELQTQRAGHSLFRELLIRDFVWFDTRKDGIGAFLSHSQKQLRELQIATTQPLGQFVLHLSRVLSGIILAFTISWSVTLVTMAGIPISFLVISLTSKRMSPILKAQQSELSEASKISYDAFAFIDVVKCLNGQFSTYTRMMTRIRAAARLYMKMAVLNSVQTAFPRFMSLIMFVQGFWFGSVQVQKGKLNPGDVLTTFWACMIVTQSVSSIVYFSAALIRGEIAGETLHQYINAHDKADSQSKINGGRRPNLYAENIILKRVTFAYPSRPDQLILRDLNMEFPAGKTTFIVGHSGAGKSTLINLLLKFFTPSSGGILVGDTPYQMIDPTWIRRNVTLVQQNSFLFNESLFNNIAYGTRHPAFVTREQIDLCIELANLTSTVQSLPNRLQTIVGFGGSLLSGGQKQRVALARARMKNSPVLILDEFTSALDHDNRATVMEAVRKWRDGMTTIIVTHDTSNILADDFVYVLEAGTVAASGFKRDLIKGSQSAIFAQATADLPPSKAPWNEDRGYELDSMDDFEHSWFDDTSSELWSPSSESTSLIKQTFTTEFNKSYAEDIVQFSPPPQIALRVMTPLSHRPRPAINSELSFCNLDDDDQHLSSPTRIDNLFTRSGRYRKLKQKNTTKSINTTLPLHKTFMTIPSTLSKRQRILLAGAAALAAIHAGSTPVFSYLLSHLFDSFYVVDKSKASSIAKKYSVAIVGLAAIDSIIFFSMYYIFEYCSQAWMDRLRSQSIRRILSQPCSWFEKEENGPLQLTICLDQHAEEIRNLAGKFGGFLMIGIMTAFIAVVWSFLLKWQLTFVSLSCVPIWYGVSTGLKMVNTKWEKKLNDLNEDMANVFSEAFTDIATVRAFTMENHFTIKISQVLQRKLSVAAKRGIYTGIFSGLAESVIIFASALLIYYAAVLAAPDAMGISNIVSVLTMILFSLAHAVWMMSWIPQLNAANDTATRLIKLSQLPEGSSSHETRGNLRVFQPVPIVFNDLSFYYPSRPEASALRNFSCVIPENKCTAIVGSSGSGKSTIVSLLLKLYACPEPSFGDDSTPAISLGGVDIRQLHTSTLRNLIGYVPQQPRLFADTIRANITYGLDPYSRFNSLKNIEAAATAAGITDFVRSLPEGYSTVVGEGGLKLSGGQAQRLVIARALVRHPRVLIMDEATSSLDAENADLIRTSVKRLLATQAQGLTVIMVTHSRDMMEMADNVIVMDNGKAVEQGTLMALLKRSDGRLREMLNS